MSLSRMYLMPTGCAPFFQYSAPRNGAAKTTLMDLLRLCTRKCFGNSGISAAAIYRVIDKWQPTLMGDEGDAQFAGNEPLRQVFNSGHHKGLAYIVKCDPDKQ